MVVLGLNDTTVGLQWDYSGRSWTTVGGVGLQWEEWDYSGATVGLQWGYSGATVRLVGLQWDYNGATVGLQWDYNGATVRLQWGYSGATVRLQWEEKAMPAGSRGRRGAGPRSPCAAAPGSPWFPSGSPARWCGSAAAGDTLRSRPGSRGWRPGWSWRLLKGDPYALQNRRAERHVNNMSTTR